jgi:putative FmdB family regulatory protein
MPIYEFVCSKCSLTFEETKKYDENDANCPVCSEKANKIMSTTSFSVAGGTRSVDSFIGEDADRRWSAVRERKINRDRQQYGSISSDDIKDKDNKRISSILDKQKSAHDTIERAKQDAGITKRDELNHVLKG